MDTNTDRSQGKSVDPQHVIDVLREQVQALVDENIMLGAFVRQQEKQIEALLSESGKEGGDHDE